jgi:hypothetical protein
MISESMGHHDSGDHSYHPRERCAHLEPCVDNGKQDQGHSRDQTGREPSSRGGGVGLSRRSGEFPMRCEELNDAAATVYEGI